MESTNNILKNEYLIHRKINSFDDLKLHLQNDIHLYNTERPHGSLGVLTPNQFERYILNIPICQRTLMPVFTDKSKKHNLIIIMPQDQQLKLNF